MGSREGLIRYDGYAFTLFDHDINNPDSLSDNSIRTIFEDRQGNLWVGTNTGGLDRLDRANWRFEHFRHDPANPRSLSHNSVYAIVEDPAGGIWVGTQKGLNRFDPVLREFERFMEEPDGNSSPSNDYVAALAIDRWGALWVGTVGGGLDRRDPATGRFERFRHDPADPASLSDDSVFAILEDPTGELWVGTRKGLDRLLPGARSFTRIPIAPGSPAGLEGGLIASLALGRDGVIWAGSFGGGLHEIEPSTGRVRVHTYEQEREQSLMDGRVASLLSTPSGDLWVGTFSGLCRRRAAAALFSSIDPRPAGAGVYASTDIYSPLEDRLGRLWLASFGEGLFLIEPDRGVVRRFSSDDGQSGMGRSLIHLIEDRRGRIWAGATDGLYCFDPDRGTSRAYRHSPEVRKGIGPGYVSAILEDRAGRIWVGTGEGGLHRLLSDEASFEAYRPDTADPRSLSDEYVTVIFEDRGGLLWIGTRSGGLNAFDPAKRSFTRYQPDVGDERSLGHHYVTSILEDAAGRLWIGTGGGGVNLVERRGGVGRVLFTRITERDGLIDDNVMALAEDRDGSLWIATRRGLSRYDPSRRTFANYGAADLPTSAEFNLSGSTRGADSIYFGTTRGALLIAQGAPFPSPSGSPTVIASVRSIEGPLAGDRPPWLMDRLTVPYGKVISFEFIVLDFDDRERHRYAYLLGPSQRDWVDLGTRRDVTFTDLKPGEYDLFVRARNAQGVWSEAPGPLRIRVVPPFWMSAWFRGTVVLCVVGLAVGIHALRIRALERRNRELVQLKEQRETALGETRAKEEQLQLAYDRLTTLTRRLEESKEDERRRIARELHDEMAQSLTAAKINLRMLSRHRDPAATRQRVEDTIGLVDRMIGHVRALSLDLRPPMLDELGLPAALRGYLESVSRRAGIEIQVFEETPIPGVLPPEIAIAAFRTVQEAVTNVVRHAGASGVTVVLRCENGVLSVSVRDDGFGFDVPAALERGTKGAGLGLLGLIERVRGLKGEALIDSAPGRGTEVSIRVPLSN